MRLPTLVTTLLVVTLSLEAHAADFFAKQISKDNLHELPDGGMDAVGGIGDWLLSNGTLCAVVSDATHPTYLSLEGGSLVDLWHCSKADDQWSVGHTQLNLQKDEIPPTDAIRAGTDAKGAWLEVEGRRDGLVSLVRYTLGHEIDNRLSIETTVTRENEGAQLGMLGAMVLHPRASLRPFSIDSVDTTQNRGLALPAVDTTDIASVMASVTTTDHQIFMGSRQLEPGISYGVKMAGAMHRSADGEESPVTHFMMGGRDFTMFGAFSQPFPSFWSRTPGLVSFGLGQLMDLDVGESLIFQQEIIVSDRADVASITDDIYKGAMVSGHLPSAEAGLTVRDHNGTPLTVVQPDADGSFRFRLPTAVEKFDIEVITPWGDYNFPDNAVADKQLISLGELHIEAPATLALPQGAPMNLLFERDGEDTRFHTEYSTLTVGEKRAYGGAESYRFSLSGSATDITTIQLAPGDYLVTASRGLEYSATQARVSLQAGKTSTLTIATPEKAVDTPKLIGIDMHVHSGVSFDSSLPLEQRIRDFVAHGGEVLVPTEHNVTYDFQSVIESMGLESQLISITGIEITGMARSEAAPTTIAHSNIFPVTASPDEYMGGTLHFEGKRLGQVIGDYKSRYPDSVFQLNHPRTEAFDDDITFFNHLSQGVPYDPNLPLEQGDNKFLVEALPNTEFRDIDFDAIELLNGESIDIYQMVRKDWFSLLLQNHYKVGTANSDSHVGSQLVTYPRNYLAVENDNIESVSVEEVMQAVKNGAVYGTTGPIIRVALNGKGPGETVAGSGGRLTVTAASADWVSVDTVHIWLNGELWQSLPLDENNKAEVEVSVENDSFLFVEVEGDATPMYEKLLPGFKPFAFANPIFVDVAGDGWRIKH